LVAALGCTLIGVAVVAQRLQAARRVAATGLQRHDVIGRLQAPLLQTDSAARLSRQHLCPQRQPVQTAQAWGNGGHGKQKAR